MLRLATWVCCCCGCGRRRPAGPAEHELEDAVNRGDVERAAELLAGDGGGRAAAGRALRFSSEYERAAVTRGALRGRERYVATATDGWKHVEILHGRSGGYQHMAAHTQSTVYDVYPSRREDAARARVPAAARVAHDWRFSEQVFLTAGTLLHLAVLRGSRDMVLLLLAAGAVPSRKGAWLWTGGASSPIYGTYVVKESLRGTPLALATARPGGASAEFPSPVASALANWDAYALVVDPRPAPHSAGARYDDAASVRGRRPSSSSSSAFRSSTVSSRLSSETSAATPSSTSASS